CGMGLLAPRSLEGIEGPCVGCGGLVVARDGQRDGIVTGGADSEIPGCVSGAASDCGIRARGAYEHGRSGWSDGGDPIEIELLKGEMATGGAAQSVPVRRIEMVEHAGGLWENIDDGGAGRFAS
ncbi:MAG: hypothetical protein P8J87_00675, partial [Verrucomicrobiales bacterium]|nr:hypothetical protein [Verrucomicrobiales bacterium]